ncbi:MAG TPA: energy transducer TonB, partial [Bacteroidota bacterium]|nr:energy transducer TonB [Bacteroidota bacterium]
GEPERAVVVHIGQGRMPIPILPPRLNPTDLTNINVGGGKTHQRSGVPVPIPPAIVDTAVELAPNVNLNPLPGPGTGEPGPWSSPDTTWLPPEDPGKPFEPVEGYPKLVRGASPVYPDLAVLSGQEGLVRVKILVDRGGKPGAVSVVSSTADIFNDAAVAAAWKFLFTPGYSNSGPVPVSVEVPFRFRLADRK